MILGIIYRDFCINVDLWKELKMYLNWVIQLKSMKFHVTFIHLADTFI